MFKNIKCGVCDGPCMEKVNRRGASAYVDNRGGLSAEEAIVQNVLCS